MVGDDVLGHVGEQRQIGLLTEGEDNTVRVRILGLAGRPREPDLVESLTGTAKQASTDGFGPHRACS
ncbi:MAG: hypothetical protein WAV54_12495 [Acidimicrobiales bacterium]